MHYQATRNRTFFALSDPTAGRLHDASQWMGSYRRGWEARLDRFEGFVEARKAGRG